MSEEESILEFFLDKLEESGYKFKDIPAWDLGRHSINAMIRKSGGTVNEDLDYAQADARHWHQGYLKMKDAYEDISSRFRSMQEEQRQRGDDAERDVNELLGSREADKNYIAILEERIDELKQSLDSAYKKIGYLKETLEDEVQAYQEYVELLKGQNSDLEDHIRSVDSPLKSDHPAIIDAEKSGYERGWDAAVAEFKPKIQDLKDILEETREERVTRNDVIDYSKAFSTEADKQSYRITQLEARLDRHESNSLKWRDSVERWLRDLAEEILNGE